MTRISRAAVGAIAIALAAAPITSAIAGGYGSHHGNRHHGHGYYGNPFAPVVGLAAAVVGTAAAIVTLPFAILGAAAAPAYYAPPGPRQSYYPPQGNGGPGYGAPYAYYPAPPQSNSYVPPSAQYRSGPPPSPNTYAQRAPMTPRSIPNTATTNKIAPRTTDIIGRVARRRRLLRASAATLWRTECRLLLVQLAQSALSRFQRAPASSVAPAAKRKTAAAVPSQAPAPARRRGGRPSRDEAAQLPDRILDAATELFFARGYGATSIEAVAQRAGSRSAPSTTASKTRRRCSAQSCIGSSKGSGRRRQFRSSPEPTSRKSCAGSRPSCSTPH
jgi:hypothetical protein